MVFAPGIANANAETRCLHRPKIHRRADVRGAAHDSDWRRAGPVGVCPSINFKMFERETISKNSGEKHEPPHSLTRWKLNNDVSGLKRQRMRFADPFRFWVAIDRVLDLELVPGGGVRGKNFCIACQINLAGRRRFGGAEVQAREQEQQERETKAFHGRISRTILQNGSHDFRRASSLS